jgi:predicted dienelactone hydrolase
MRVRAVVPALAVGVSLAACGASPHAAARTPAPVPRPVAAQHVQLALVDRSRPATDPGGTRSAPVRTLTTELYLPAGTGPHPLVVFAHGYNGDPTKFTELFQHWSDAGLAVLAPQFPITFTDPVGGPLARAGDIARQPRDMTFVLDQLLAGRYRDRIDRARIAVAGLSLGGGTVWGLITDRCCLDRRFRAAIVMDGNRFGFGDTTYVANRIPVLMYHADRDYSLSYAAATAAYQKLAPPKYLVTIEEAVHAQPYENTPDPADPMVVRSSVDYLRAYLLGDAAAKARIVADATVPGVSHAESDAARR